MKASLILLAILSLTVQASDNNTDPCNATSGGVTAAHLCVSQKIKGTGTVLNKAYEEALQRVKEEESALRQNWTIELVGPFQKAQNAWVNFRDAQCQFTGLASTPSP